MTDALSTPEKSLKRPPISGPGSGTEEWRAFVAQETGRTDLDGKSRDQLVAILEHLGDDGEPLREVPEADGVDVEVLEAEEDDEGRLRPPRIEGSVGPQWAVPVVGGYAGEDDLVKAERAAERERTAKRHEDRLSQLRKRKNGS